MLIFPSKSPHRGLAYCLDDWHSQRLAANLAMGGAALIFANAEQRVVRDRFNETVTQRVDRKPPGSNGLRRGDVFLNLGTNCPIVDQSASGDHLLAVVDRNARILENAPGT